MNLKPTFSVITRLSLILTASIATAVGAAETSLNHWPQWRGPSGNGIVPQGNPPLTWAENQNIKWKVEIPGQGHATPIIWGNKVFILTAVPTGVTKTPESSARVPNAPSVLLASAQSSAPQQGQGESPRRGRGLGGGGRGGFGGQTPTEEFTFNVLCLDRATGATLWTRESRREIPHQGIQRSNTYASGSPVTDGERLYAWFGSQGLFCYDFDGALLWQKDLGEVSVTFGEGSSPALAGDVLIVVQDSNGDSFVYGLNKRTGKLMWKKPRDEGSGWTTPYVLTRDGKTQVIINGSTAVRSYDPQTGEVLWQCSGLGSNPVPMIVSDETTVYAMSGHRNGAALAIELGHSGDLTGTAAVRWTTDRGTPYVPSPLLYDGLLYFCQRTSATWSCLDPATGTPHYDQVRLDGISGVYSSPIGAAGRIYLAGQNGATLVLAHAKELKVLATNQLDDGFDASPVVVGDELFLRGRKHLYCIAQMLQ